MSKTTPPSHVMRFDIRADQWVCLCGFTSTADWPDVVRDFEAHKAEAVSE